ncbi:MAG: hypothetical protein JNJ90_01765 [Saprospiraceae bacterium]|jgi:hypothetical protein|nr:hypothetical protein [Saprospiraceae bacterium]
MNFFKNFAQLAALAFVALPIANLLPPSQTGTNEAGATIVIRLDVEPQAAAYIKFDGVDGECEVKEGRNTVGSNTRTGEKLIVVVKNGKLAEFGVQPARGKFKALAPSATPCFTTQCTTLNPPKCFVQNGVCICVCGPWITAATGGRN